MSTLLTSESQGPRDVRPADRKRARAPAVEHLSVEERAARGKAARTDVGRSVHGDWAPATGRRDPVELLEEQAATRVQRSWCPSATAACWCRRSPSTAAPPLSWPPISRTSRAQSWTCSCAATRTCRTSASSPHPTGGWSSASTTSTRRFRGRSSGTSSGSPRASPSLAATADSTTSNAHAINRAVTRAYRDAMAGFARMRTMELWYTRLDVDEIAARWASQGKRQAAQALRAQRGEGA